MKYKNTCVGDSSIIVDTLILSNHTSEHTYHCLSTVLIPTCENFDGKSNTPVQCREENHAYIFNVNHAKSTCIHKPCDIHQPEDFALCCRLPPGKNTSNFCSEYSVRTCEHENLGDLVLRKVLCLHF